MPDAFMLAYRALIISTAARNNVPAVYSELSRALLNFAKRALP
jgi:hypothetical protein